MVSTSSQYSLKPLTSSYIWTSLEDLWNSAPDDLINGRFHGDEAHKYQARHQDFPLKVLLVNTILVLDVSRYKSWN